MSICISEEMGRVATTQFLFDRREVSRRSLMGPSYWALGLPRGRQIRAFVYGRMLATTNEKTLRNML